MTIAIHIERLSHSYLEGDRANTVLTQLSAIIPAGQVVALLGQSGSGKSTLLNLISGLESIQSGTVVLLGEPLHSLIDRERTLLRRRRLGFIYQTFNLIPTLSVAENVALPLTLNNYSRTSTEQRVSEYLEAVGLQHRANQFPDRLSGGEQQRVAIARALAHEPELILADEPTGNLDADNGRRILDALLELVTRDQKTLFVVTHSSEVASCADLVLTLQHGELQQGRRSSVW